MRHFLLIVWLLALVSASAVETKKKSSESRTPTPTPGATPAAIASAPNASLDPGELAEFSAQPDAVKKLIEASLALARQDLTYAYGSADPANGGLDCSGFIYYVLRQHGFAQVPRDSSGQYTWVRRARTFRAVLSRKASSFEFDELLPGDLLFWSGTYAIERDPPITHVMIFLGTEKATGAKVMIGSSDGRTYRGKRRWGVSVFDFAMPKQTNGATFVGYARIPGLRD